MKKFLFLAVVCCGLAGCALPRDAAGDVDLSGIVEAVKAGALEGSKAGIGTAVLTATTNPTPIGIAAGVAILVASAVGGIAAAMTKKVEPPKP